MADNLVHPQKARPGDKVAVVSPSFAAPGVAPAVHEQALRRLTEVTGLVPVEYSTTRRVGSSPQDRAADLNAAFADPEIRAILATIGGEDQITVVPHLDPELVRADPKPFLGYSDNTNILSWLWTQGVAGFYGGSTQVHLGPGPAVDPCHGAALRAALLTGERLEVTEPGESEDIGKDWADPLALTEYGDREPTEAWTWARDVAIEVVGMYNPHAIVCIGIPFGHTRPQWVLPYGGEVTVDGIQRKIWSDYR